MSIPILKELKLKLKFYITIPILVPKWIVISFFQIFRNPALVVNLVALDMIG